MGGRAIPATIATAMTAEEGEILVINPRLFPFFSFHEPNYSAIQRGPPTESGARRVKAEEEHGGVAVGAEPGGRH